MDDAWAERIWTELHRIASVLEALIPDQIQEPETPTCSHPTECRIDFGTTNGQPDWMCTVCRYRTPCLPLDPATTIPVHP